MQLVRNFLSFDYYYRVLDGIQRTRPIFTLLILSLVIITPSYLSITRFAWPYTHDVAGQVRHVVDVLYPEDLVVTIEDGKASTNVTEPYYLSFTDEQLESAFPGIGDSARKASYRVLAVDTHAAADDFERYQSYVLLTENSIVYYTDGDIKITPLREWDDTVVSKEKLYDVVDMVEDLHIERWVIVALIALPFILAPFMLIGLMLALLFTAFLVFIMARILKVHVTFWTLFRYTVVISVVPSVVEAVLITIPLYAQYFGLIHGVMFDLIILVICYRGLKRYVYEHREEHKVSSADPAPEPPPKGAQFTLDIMGDMKKMEEASDKQS